MAINNNGAGQGAGSGQGAGQGAGQGTDTTQNPNGTETDIDDEDEDDDDDPIVKMKQSKFDATVQKRIDKAVKAALKGQPAPTQQTQVQQPVTQGTAPTTPNGGVQGGIDYNAFAQALIQAGVIQPQGQQTKQGGTQAPDADFLVAKAESRSELRDFLRDEGIPKEKLNRAFKLLEFDTLLDTEGDLDEKKFRKQLKEVRAEFPELFGKVATQAPKKGGIVAGGNGQQPKGGTDGAVHSAIRTALFGGNTQK